MCCRYGAIKGVTTQQLLQLDCHTILGNTYHLGQRPTTPLIDKMGGLHNFMQVQAAASAGSCFTLHPSNVTLHT